MRKKLFLPAFLAILISTELLSQEIKTKKPNWAIGASVGLNLNIFQIQGGELNEFVLNPIKNELGIGYGLFLAPTVEYHSPHNFWGAFISEGYDSRQFISENTSIAENCQYQLSTNISFVALEAGVKIYPWNKAVYLFTGPRIAWIFERNFILNQYDISGKQLLNHQSGELSQMRKSQLSGMLGFGKDLIISRNHNRSVIILSPCFYWLPPIGANPRNFDDWKISTLRFGMTIKIGSNKPQQ